jgi:uncharacterized DUF497 family protein
MVFEFDSKKSKQNKDKHGIDFSEAQKIWEDADCVMIPARTISESRLLLICKYNEKIWSAIFTFRQDKVRIISVRRSRKNEEEIYKS